MSLTKINFSKQLLGAAWILGSLFLSASSEAIPVFFQVSGANPAAIQATVDAFRAGIGGVNNGVGPVCLTAGRREVNWDGVPNASSTPNNIANDFFNVTSPRGIVYSTPGTAFQVSANAANPPVRFANFNATYSTTFATFSAERLFTPLASTLTIVDFFLPGTDSPAGVSAFGAVFADADLADTSFIEFFDPAGNSLLSRAVPNQAGDGGLSFLGVIFSDELISRVEITTGTTPLGPNDDPGQSVDIVVLDDFIYGEPNRLITIDDVTVTEPASGQGNAVFTLSLSEPACADTTVDVTTQDDTATSPDDFSAMPLTTVTFLSGEQTKTVSIPVNADEDVEADETFLVLLSNPVGAGIADDAGVGTILDFVASATPTPTPVPTPFPGDLSGNGCALGMGIPSSLGPWIVVIGMLAPMTVFGSLRFRRPKGGS